ncbi:TPA: 16S rRNA methyltransferase [Candidatus Poribacteria bacterium]|nr:16S rRNA methyltransferase [Candidatus Poribacteria bacterium]
MGELQTLIDTIQSSKKYATICFDTIKRIGENELRKNADVKIAIKATKRKLHQIFGCYTSRRKLDYDGIYEHLKAAYDTQLETEIKETCRRVLRLHTSTTERIPVLEKFYESIFDVTGQPKIVIDAACGLNPLTIPWMGLERTAQYFAYDIDRNTVDFIDRYLELTGLNSMALAQDVIVQPPAIEADVALLLKTIPCLEQQEKGCSIRLMEALQAKHLVVSFPVRSVGGKSKGMLANYERILYNLIHGRDWQATKLPFETELVFCIHKLTRELCL